MRARSSASLRTSFSRQRRVSLCETLDRVLNKGAVIAGDVVISVADVDLLYLGLNIVVTSVETMRDWDFGRRGTCEGTVAGAVDSGRTAAALAPGSARAEA